MNDAVTHLPGRMSYTTERATVCRMLWASPSAAIDLVGNIGVLDFRLDQGQSVQDLALSSYHSFKQESSALICF